jgi:hypothetical protein
MAWSVNGSCGRPVLLLLLTSSRLHASSRELGARIPISSGGRCCVFNCALAHLVGGQRSFSASPFPTPCPRIESRLKLPCQERRGAHLAAGGMVLSELATTHARRRQPYIWATEHRPQGSSTNLSLIVFVCSTIPFQHKEDADSV